MAKKSSKIQASIFNGQIMQRAQNQERGIYAINIT
jgi:hypothetical protein